LQPAPCPSGLSSESTLSVIVFLRDQSCLQNNALIVNQLDQQ
jgi:hypothetical protein